MALAPEKAKVIRPKPAIMAHNFMINSKSMPHSITRRESLRSKAAS